LKQSLSQEQSVDFQLFGRFIYRSHNEAVMFVPTLELLEKGSFKLVQNNSNISPLNKACPQKHCTKLTLALLSQLTALPKQTIA